MEKLFGVPINQLMLVLLVIFVIILAIMVWVAIRNPIIFKLALRNPPRRRSQSILIILGLMLATLLFSATFTTGDTLTHSGRVQALNEIGEIDLIIQAEARQTSGQPGYFDEVLFQTVHAMLKDTSEVAGVAPLVTEIAPIIVPDTGMNEAQVSILGYDYEFMNGFDQLENEDGSILSLSSLTSGQVFISSKLAEELAINDGDSVYTYIGSTPAALKVTGIYLKGANPSGDLSLVMPLQQLQELTGNEGKINSIIITNQGDSIKGAEHTDTVLTSLDPVLRANILEA
ncbi:MAG: ABC transporter permease, partial [Dehalococcoidales bacterium]